MLASGVNNSGLKKLIDSFLSEKEVRVFKPIPRVYQLAVEQLKTEAGKKQSKCVILGLRNKYFPETEIQISP